MITKAELKKALKDNGWHELTMDGDVVKDDWLKGRKEILLDNVTMKYFGSPEWVIGEHYRYDRINLVGHTLYYFGKDNIEL